MSERKVFQWPQLGWATWLLNKVVARWNHNFAYKLTLAIVCFLVWEGCKCKDWSFFIFHHHHNYERSLNKTVNKQGLFIFKMCDCLLGDELMWREKECLSHSWRKCMHSLSLFTSFKHPYSMSVQILSKCRLLYLPEVVNDPNQVKLNWRYYSSILISWESEELCPLTL